MVDAAVADAAVVYSVSGIVPPPHTYAVYTNAGVRAPCPAGTVNFSPLSVVPNTCCFNVDQRTVPRAAIVELRTVGGAEEACLHAEGSAVRVCTAIVADQATFNRLHPQLPAFVSALGFSGGDITLGLVSPFSIVVDPARTSATVTMDIRARRYFNIPMCSQGDGMSMGRKTIVVPLS